MKQAGITEKLSVGEILRAAPHQERYDHGSERNSGEKFRHPQPPARTAYGPKEGLAIVPT